MIKIAILGSTGSIGTQTLNVIREHKNDFLVMGLTAHSNINLLKKQISEFQPRIVGIKNKFQNKNIEILYGQNYVKEFINLVDADIYVNAISGIYGLEASIEILKQGKDLALANKESIVSFGGLLKKIAKDNCANIYPIDSEHSAIWQCLNGEDRKTIKRLLITASGGPFRQFSLKQLEKVTPKQALKHP